MTLSAACSCKDSNNTATMQDGRYRNSKLGDTMRADDTAIGRDWGGHKYTLPKSRGGSNRDAAITNATHQPNDINSKAAHNTSVAGVRRRPRTMK